MDMNAINAVALINSAIPALEYLEKMAQGNDNAEGAIIAGQVTRKEDVDLSRAFLSFKSHKGVSKAVAMIRKSVEYGNLVATAQAKAEAIETTATVADKLLATVGPKKK